MLAKGPLAFSIRGEPGSRRVLIVQTCICVFRTTKCLFRLLPKLRCLIISLSKPERSVGKFK